MQVIILSILQGLTEFLPVSSSAHLIFLPKLIGWQDQGLAFDIAVHIGTLFAVIFYFRKDLIKILKDGVKSSLGWAIVLGTIPVGLAGILCKGLIENYLRSNLVIAFSTIFFGSLLFLSVKFSTEIKCEKKLKLKDVLVIGFAQALALIPGTSRSGITLTAGMFMGLSKKAAARYSFLLSIPVIALAGMLQSYQLLKSDIIVNWSVLIQGCIISAITGYLCINLFLKLLDKIGVLPFVLYRLVLGIGLFIFI